MKQNELEHFVSQLSEAERSAAEKIRQAEVDAEQRLSNRREQLEHEHQEYLNALEQTFKQEKQLCLEELANEQQQLELETSERIERLRQRHAKKQISLVNWLVQRITQP
ncbi:hypothetical protein [Amphritea balenae]|uniref:ATPase n=1 Tax=Amphritea balenae TaxID=452629 RepID=A0A3P1SWT5_9GAMM|nr:hypothetical protein [Amphritea balenae]RRD01508.1 hypothetical protein EHS89_02820 [Amphritea balenae]GGK56457.1 hypothetical protein GCM10007941_03280 [Amphritea balenae]